MPSKVRVTIGRLYLDDIITNFEHGDVKSPSSEVEDHNLLILLFVEPVGKCGGGRLVDDALDVEAGDFSRVFGCLALGIVEIGGHRDNSLGDALAKARLRVRLQFS